MSTRNDPRRLLAAAGCVALTATGCAFHGVNSLPLPGTVGRVSGASVYRVELANVGTLEPNSPVMMSDVVVGSISKIAVKNWHANVEISLKPGVVVPANSMATVGQTSLLGSMHLAIDPPPGQVPEGHLDSGATIGLGKSSTYPSTEQTLSSLAAVVDGGGLGQIGDIIHNFNVALDGRTGDLRDLLGRLNNLVDTLDGQRDNIAGLIQGLNRLSTTLAGQRDVLSRALQKIPPALDVLIEERPRITTALEKLGNLSDIAHRLVADSQADLIQNLQNLGPVLRTLADVGPGLDRAVSLATTFPYTQNFIDRAIRGDYVNLFIVSDITIPRLKKTVLLGTRWGDKDAVLVPAPGDPWYLNYNHDPLGFGVAAPIPQPSGTGKENIVPSVPFGPPDDPQSPAAAPPSATPAETPSAPPEHLAGPGDAPVPAAAPATPGSGG
jgi:phospholipid/cholesterol/gamma-HCH transport system substrate-binding protein